MMMVMNPGMGMGMGMGMGAMGGRPGDWRCAAPGCNTNNWPVRWDCRRCSTPKGVCGPPMMGVPPFLGGGAPQQQGVMHPGMQAAPPLMQSAMQPAAQLTQLRPGEWVCPGCHNHNYANRAQCNRCFEPCPAGARYMPPGAAAAAAPTPQPPVSAGRSGVQGKDWKCPQCTQKNWADRENCARCQRSRPQRGPEDLPPRGIDERLPAWARRGFCGATVVPDSDSDTGDDARGKPDDFAPIAALAMCGSPHMQQEALRFIAQSSKASGQKRRLLLTGRDAGAAELVPARKRPRSGLDLGGLLQPRGGSAPAPAQRAASGRSGGMDLFLAAVTAAAAAGFAVGRGEAAGRGAGAPRPAGDSESSDGEPDPEMGRLRRRLAKLRALQRQGCDGLEDAIARAEAKVAVQFDRQRLAASGLLPPSGRRRRAAAAAVAAAEPSVSRSRSRSRSPSRSPRSRAQLPVETQGPTGPLGPLELRIAPGSSPPAVAGVTPEGNAQRAGIKPGDVILRVNGSDVTDRTQLARRCSLDCGVAEGETVLVTVRRRQKRRPPAEFELALKLAKAKGGWRRWLREADAAERGGSRRAALAQDVQRLRRELRAAELELEAEAEA
eukprot:TRINITY_DN4716_c0_g2_i1.p1 TRINITY_DN4716_c0_g2~~TRINITY_DN4716_c0_g2_i1.p1  ORF type:complete len:638 (+),score=164.55 TRINITY_DN4716_c0_g2_i1:93-1916(+)